MYKNANKRKAVYGWYATGDGNMTCKLMVSIDETYMSNGITTVILPSAGAGVAMIEHHVSEKNNIFIKQVFHKPKGQKYETTREPSPIFKGYDVIDRTVKYKGLHFNSANYKTSIRLIKVLYNTSKVWVNINPQLSIMNIFTNLYDGPVAVVQVVKK